MDYSKDPYLHIGRASDLKDKKERIIYRLLEIFPGALSWTTLIAVIIFSWLRPAWVAIFIICFVAYWLFRTLYFSFLLHSSFKKMKRSQETDWLEKVKSLPEEKWQNVYHLIIFPFYKESLEIIRESFLALERSDYPKDKMIVVLAAEERAGLPAKEVAERISQEFGKKFFRFLITYHPEGLLGEIAGKGSNESWAARKAKEEIIDPLKIPYQNIIVSSLDVDTCVFPKYFSCLTYHYLTLPDADKISYQPIPLFINNAWQANSLSRIFSFSASFWQFMNQERPEKQTTFSSHSMSFKALVDVGFRQVNVVSDDSRIFWQCFLKYNGNYRVKALYYPVSMDANLASSFWRTAINIYKQQRRWAYGVGEIPYFLFGFWKNNKIPRRKKFLFGLEFIEGFWSWATGSIMFFMLGWLPLVLGGPDFGQTLLSYNLPQMTRNILTLGMIGLIFSAYISILVLPPKPPGYRRWRYLILAFEWLLVPVLMIFFTAFPALEAQTRLMLGKYMGFWPTEKFRKKLERRKKTIEEVGRLPKPSHFASFNTSH
jgi:hypothetical protein